MGHPRISADVLDELLQQLGAQVALLADVPSFTEAQADALESFVRRGGSAVFFLGPATDADNYNQRFVERFGDSGGLLPGRIGKPVGQVGRAAPAVRAVRLARERRAEDAAVCGLTLFAD